MEANRGRYFLIGGGPAARTPGEIIMPRFVEVAGPDARVAIITSGSDDPEEVNACYWDIFAGLGLRDFYAPKIPDRSRADEAWVADGIASCNAVFVAGGAQSKLADRLCGTATERAIADVFRRGGILCGTSSGTSLFAHPMILDGAAWNPHLRPGMIEVGPGFGILENTFIDTHCSSRARIPRILSLLIQHPDMLAIGMDEDTAMYVDADGIGEVLGYHSVWVLDARGTRNAHGEAAVGEGHLCLSGVRLHALSTGDRFDLRNRCVPGSAPTT